MKKKFQVTGMSCSACVAHVEKAVKGLDGVKECQVNLLSNSMTVSYDENQLKESTIIEAVEKVGYGASIFAEKKEVKKEETGKQEEDQMKERFIVSLIFLIPLFYISMGHMMGLPIPGWLVGTENAIAFAMTQFLLTLPIVYKNRSYFIRGFQGLYRKTPNMDSLIAIGSCSAIFYGIFAIYRIGYGFGHGQMELVHRYAMDLYFESAGTILTLITLGKYLETRSKGKTKEALSKLLDLAPKTAMVERDGKEIEIPVEDVVVGDTLVVRSGSKVPVDGVIVEGYGSLDQSALTGESVPVDKQVGDAVMGATLNVSGFFKFQAKKVGENTTISQIITLVEEASSSKAPIAKLADKISGIFVPVVITIAILSVIVWLFLGQPFEFALSIGIAVLVISCPCALGLATPVAIMVGTGKGAEEGILVKSAECLQLAEKIQTVVLDKTGTITEGKPKVTDCIPYGGFTKDQLGALAMILESPSEHPISKAIVQYGKEHNFKEDKVDRFETLVGRGIYCEYKNENYYIGNERLMTEQGIAIEKEKEVASRLANEGKTPLFFAKEKQLIGIFGVADTVKETSYEGIANLQNMGLEVIMLTGDNEETASAIWKKVGCDRMIANVLPQEKEKVIRKLQESGKKVAMVGDGINDAPSLARADVGIAIGAGTDIALESADMILMKNDLRDIGKAITLSKKVMNTVKQNLFWAFFYNCIGIPLAAGVFYSILEWRLNPMFGAFAMSLSSFCVVTNALRLKGVSLGAKARKEEHKNSNQIEEHKLEEKGDKKMEKVMVIEGMMCGHCKANVEKTLKAMDGVNDCVVNLEEKTATISLEKEVDNQVFIDAIKDAGYEPISIQ